MCTCNPKQENHCNWHQEAGLDSSVTYWRSETEVPNTGLIEKQDLLDLVTPNTYIAFGILNTFLNQFNKQSEQSSIYFVDSYLLERWCQMLGTKYKFNYNDPLLLELPKGIKLEVQHFPFFDTVLCCT